jgi:DNA-binding transcriptional LysR family regulator
VVFFDASVRQAPADLADYLAAEHATVVYEPRRALDIDDALAELGVQRRLVVSVPGFAGIAAFVRGSDRLCTAPSLLRDHALRGLAWAWPPLPCPALPMYLIWHARQQADPLHRWLRKAIEDAATAPIESAVAAAGPT